MDILDYNNYKRMQVMPVFKKESLIFKEVE